MFKQTTAFIAAVSGALLMATAPAQAACFGCNIVDDGTFSRLSPGATVYYHTTLDGSRPLRVVFIDSANRRVLVRDQRGYQSWVSASALYTRDRTRERDMATIGVGIGFLALLAGSSSGSGSSQTRSSGVSNWAATRPGADADRSENDERDASGDGCYWGNREDGTCQ